MQYNFFSGTSIATFQGPKVDALYTHFEVYDDDVTPVRPKHAAFNATKPHNKGIFRDMSL